MNRYILIGFIFFITISCKEKKTEPQLSNVYSNEKVELAQKDLAMLKKAFAEKDEALFMKQFPDTFNEFQNYFGWDPENKKPQPLYKESLAYIRYWFSLLSKKEFIKYQKQLIEISENGHWEADGINYFQDGALMFIKENKKYNLINELNNSKAKSVLFFLFDGPHPRKDTEFISNLNPEKQTITKILFETNFNQNEAKQELEINRKPLREFSYFENSPDYFIENIDINKDGKPDKVVSSKKYKGNQLFFYLKNDKKCKFALESINFSEDGGNVIDTIYKPKGNSVLAIKTYFPDGGYLTATHYINYDDRSWTLQKTIYKTKVSNEKETTVYSCEVPQNLLLKKLTDSIVARQIKYIPSEKDRDTNCDKKVIAN